MRIGTSVAVIVLLSLAVCVAFFSLRRRSSEQKEADARTSERKEADARKTLAFESLIERLPKGKPCPPTRALSSEAKKRWEILDQELAWSQDPRAKLLKELHEKTRKFFVDSPGAGPVRRLETPEEILLDDVGQAAALGVGAVEDSKVRASATQTGSDSEQAAAGELVPAVDGETQACQPAADGAGAAAVQKSGLAEGLQGVAFDGEEQAVQEEGHDQASPDAVAIGFGNTIPAETLYGGGKRSDNHGRHRLATVGRFGRCLLCTTRCLFREARQKAQGYWMQRMQPSCHHGRRPSPVDSAISFA